MRYGALLSVLLLSSAAFAQNQPLSGGPGLGPAGHWSIISGETVSPGRDAIAFQVGWPGMSFDYLHGLTDRTDVGLAIDMLYGVEGTSTSRFGFGLGVPFRLVLNRNDKVLLGLHIDPGFRVYTSNGSSDLLMRFPVGGVLAIRLIPELRLSVGVDVPMAAQLTHGGAFLIGPQFGFGLEYTVDRNLLVGLDTRFGPLFTTAGGDGEFSFRTLISVGYRL